MGDLYYSESYERGLEILVWKWSHSSYCRDLLGSYCCLPADCWSFWLQSFEDGKDSNLLREVTPNTCPVITANPPVMKALKANGYGHQIFVCELFL